MKITALLSMPRIGFTDNMFCVAALIPLGITIGRHSGAFWEQSLSKLLYECVERRDDDYIITVDYDSVFQKEHVIELIRIAEETKCDAVVPVQLKRNTSRVLAEIHRSEISDGVIDSTKRLTRIKAGHFGLTVIRVSSLAKLPHPWLWSVPNANTGRWEDGKIDADINFWNIAGEGGADWTIYQANQVRIGHIQQVITWPTPQWTVHQQYLDQWESEGVPREVGVPVLPSPPLEHGAGHSTSAPRPCVEEPVCV